MRLPGYFSTELASYYVARSGAVNLVGSIETDGAVWEPCERLPADAEPADFAEELAAEAGLRGWPAASSESPGSTSRAELGAALGPAM